MPPTRRLGLAAFVLSILSLAGCGGSSGSGSPTGVEEVVEETVELLLAAIDEEGQPLPVDSRGVTIVQPGRAFTLELRYLDHRPAGERLGASEVFVDLLADQADVLRPVIAETFRIIVGAEIRSASAGTVAISLEGGNQTFLTTGTAFTGDPEGTLIGALTLFGYTLDKDYALTRLALPGNDIGLQITWHVVPHGNTDMPDIFLDLRFPEQIPSQAVEFAPLEFDGVTPNLAALPFSVDTRSRGFNDGERFYGSVEAGFGSMGFTRVGGRGPEAAGGVPALNDDGTLARPFDAFRLRVVVATPVTGLVIRATPTGSGEAIVMYGDTDEVPDPDIRLDGGHALVIDATPR